MDIARQELEAIAGQVTRRMPLPEAPQRPGARAEPCRKPVPDALWNPQISPGSRRNDSNSNPTGKSSDTRRGFLALGDLGLIRGRLGGLLRRGLLGGLLLGKTRIISTAFLDTSGLTDPITQIQELGAAGLTLTANFDSKNDRGVERESPLDTLACHDAPNCKGRAYRVAALNLDHRSGEDLDALLLTLADLDVYIDGVTYLESTESLFSLVLGFYLIDHI